MALGEKKQTMLTSMFTKISHEERKCVVAKEFDQLKAIAAAKREIQREIIEKRQVGRPRENTMLICPSTIKQEEEEHDARRKKFQHLQKKRHLYNIWFTNDLFPPIQETIKRYGRTQAAIHYLKIAFRTLGGPSPYKKN
jgi:vacuolar-type H+-ATPase subunit F/Vma7